MTPQTSSKNQIRKKQHKNPQKTNKQTAVFSDPSETTNPLSFYTHFFLNWEKHSV